MAKILSMADSPSNGLCFCTGSFSARTDNDLGAMVRRFAPNIHAVHLRSTERLPDGSFFEADHLAGSVDMPDIVTALLEEQDRRRAIGREDARLAFRPDHGHVMMNDLAHSAEITPGYFLHRPHARPLRTSRPHARPAANQVVLSMNSDIPPHKLPLGHLRPALFVTTINYVDRQILSLLQPMLDVELGWTNTQFGYANSAFQAAYAVSLLFFGWFIDRRGTKIGYAVSIAAWSVAAVGHAFVFSVAGFIAARVALGLGEGGNFPAAIKATAQWFPKKERAFATSIFNAGANVGNVIAPALVPFIALHFGWHWTFILAGIAGFVWLLFWFPLFASPRESARVSPSELALIESDPVEEGDVDGKVTWGQVLRHRQARSFIVAKFLTDPVWWFFLIWLPDYFKRERIWTSKTARCSHRDDLSGSSPS